MDIENLIGFGRLTFSDAKACRAQYADRAPVGPHDLVVVACNHGAAIAVGSGWNGARLLLRSGQHGADLALLDVIERENVVGRFASIVVASGDGRFADPVAWLGRQGVEVTVVSNGRALSRRLRLASKRVVIFDAEPVPANPGVAALKAA